MRVLDWERLLSEHRIAYATQGPGIGRGEIGLRCPFCGSADPSMHMGINLETGWWSCWRNRAQHSGKSPLRLIMRLLNVSYGRARELAGLGDDYVDPDGFDAVAARLLSPRKAEPPKARAAPQRLVFEKSIQPIKGNLRARRHWNYLYQRGFDGQRGGVDDVDRLCDEYGLMAGMDGEWASRVIIPFFLDGQMVSWTARAIAPSGIRYRDLDAERSVVAPKDLVYNGDALRDGGRLLVIVEGQFDALKLDFYGRRVGVRAVALGTNTASDAQVHRLAHTEAFRKVVVMMDNTGGLGVVDSMRLAGSLGVPRALGVAVPYGRKDAGDLTASQVKEWCNMEAGA